MIRQVVIRGVCARARTRAHACKISFGPCLPSSCPFTFIIEMHACARGPKDIHAQIHTHTEAKSAGVRTAHLYSRLSAKSRVCDKQKSKSALVGEVWRCKVKQCC
jgi:hypothetical protein